MNIGLYVKSQNSNDYITSISAVYSKKENLTFYYLVTLQKDKPYYLVIQVKKKNVEQNVTISISNEVDILNISKFNVSSGDSSSFEYNTTFKPYIEANNILITSNIELDTSDIVIKVYEIKNIINYLSSNKLLRIGILSRSGLLICLNGEPIRINNSGLFEINIDDINLNVEVNKKFNIDFIGYIPSSNPFILDYQFKEGI